MSNAQEAVKTRHKETSLIFPDLALVKTLSDAGCRVIAEGRYNTPAQAADAMRHGAWAVTVGSAITRLEHICQWYNTAMKKAVL